MKKTIQITLVLLFSSLTIFGQTKETKTADTFFKNLSFVSASEVYKELAEKNPTEHVLKRLGDSYYNNVLMQEASEAYSKLFATYTPEDSEYMFKYAQTLRATGNFKDSDIWMEKFNKAAKDDSRGENFTNKNAVLSELQNSKPDYEVTNLRSINTTSSDFGVTDYGNTILFSSPRGRNPFIKRSHTRNNKNFLDFFKVIKEKITTNEGDDSGVKPMFTDIINSQYHESSATFSPDKQTMYFTRNNYNKGSYKVDKDGYNKLKIYRSTWNYNKWDNVEELPFSSNEYSVGHPSLSKDGKKLYFSSDMPGSIGATDIYVVDVNEDGTFGTVQNLGTKVNTEGREMFPFISDEDVLYFSSDGHFGIGALDIFESKKENGTFTEPVNLKSPVNSKLDDFAFSINPKTKKGYLSSNREGGLGDDDIYAVQELKTPAPCMQVVSGVVMDQKINKPISGARLLLKDAKGLTLKDTIVGVLGQFNFKLPCSTSYSVIATKEYYKQDAKSFVTTKASNLELNLNLEVNEDFVYNQRDELLIRINPIYFDYDKSNIRPDATIELEKIIRIMNKYPKLVIRSSSHTDARGKDSYNEALSDRRAKSTVAYIVSKGISSSRITGKGFGETQLTNNCVDNNTHTNRVKCTKDEHQANRRTEFVIVKM